MFMALLFAASLLVSPTNPTQLLFAASLLVEPTPTHVTVPRPPPVSPPVEAAAPTAACPAPADHVEQAFTTAFTGRQGCIVAVIRCEGHNQYAWDMAAAQGVPPVAVISPTGDAGPAQINQIHGQPGGIIEGRWPQAVQTLHGNIAAALALHDAAGWAPWRNSRHCHHQH